MSVTFGESAVRKVIARLRTAPDLRAYFFGNLFNAAVISLRVSSITRWLALS